MSTVIVIQANIGGSLRVGGRTAGCYNAVAASYGLQADVQTFGYAVFFMNEAKLKYLDESEGWKIGGTPSLVIVNKGIAGSVSMTSARDDIYRLSSIRAG